MMISMVSPVLTSVLLYLALKLGLGKPAAQTWLMKSDRTTISPSLERFFIIYKISTYPLNVNNSSLKDPINRFRFEDEHAYQ